MKLMSDEASGSIIAAPELTNISLAVAATPIAGEEMLLLSPKRWTGLVYRPFRFVLRLDIVGAGPGRSLAASVLS